MSLIQVTSSHGRQTHPDKQAAVKVSASHLNVLLELIKRCDHSVLKGEEFDAMKYLMTSIQTQSGVFIDALHTASSIDELIEINKEFYKTSVPLP